MRSDWRREIWRMDGEAVIRAWQRFVNTTQALARHWALEEAHMRLCVSIRASSVIGYSTMCQTLWRFVPTPHTSPRQSQSLLPFSSTDCPHTVQSDPVAPPSRANLAAALTTAPQAGVARRVPRPHWQSLPLARRKLKRK